jgi:hypothetical protein
MKIALLAGAAFAAVATTTALAGYDEESTEPSWEFEVTASPTFVRDGDDFTSATATADHGPLHLEARYNYESVGARSAFVGWTFSGGEETTWELTPIVGGAWGTTQAFVPGLEATVTHGRFDLYVEAEYVIDSHDNSSSYLYSWNELGFRPVEWLRLGIAGQRTRIYGGERNIQRGPFVDFTIGKFTIAGYWFNPGSREQVIVTTIGATF